MNTLFIHNWGLKWWVIKCTTQNKQHKGNKMLLLPFFFGKEKLETEESGKILIDRLCSHGGVHICSHHYRVQGGPAFSQNASLMSQSHEKQAKPSAQAVRKKIYLGWSKRDNNTNMLWVLLLTDGWWWNATHLWLQWTHTSVGCCQCPNNISLLQLSAQSAWHSHTLPHVYTFIQHCRGTHLYTQKYTHTPAQRQKWGAHYFLLVLHPDKSTWIWGRGRGWKWETEQKHRCGWSSLPLKTSRERERHKNVQGQEFW